MEKYLAEIIREVGEAFDVPEFSGDLSRGVLKGRKSLDILGKAVQNLDRLSKEFPQLPEIPFLSGVASRYLGDDTAFLKKVTVALEINPDYLEAQIATKEGRDYLDPFCYPSVGDLYMTPRSLRPNSLLLLPVNSARLDQVRDGIRIMPLCIIKSERTKFRQLPTNEMEAILTAELCSVIPRYPQIPGQRENQPILDVLSGKQELATILAVCPVLVDDQNDPFWKVIYINVSPIYPELHGIELLFANDYQPLSGRNIGLRLCQLPPRAIFLVFDENNKGLLFKEVHPKDTTEQSLMEIGTVLKHFPETPITVSKWHGATALHIEHFHLEVESADHRLYSVPKYHTRHDRENVIFNLTTRGDRILIKTDYSIEEEQEYVHDIFFSHSHKNQSLGYALTEWIWRLSPKVRVFMTSREQQERDALLPGYYFDALKTSRCILLLATPESLHSNYVIAELGAAAGKGIKVIPICANGCTIDNLSKLRKENVTIDFDLSMAVDLSLNLEDAEKSLLISISSILNLRIPQDWHPGTLRTLLEKPRSVDETPYRPVAPSEAPDFTKQTREEALKWLDILEKDFYNKVRMAGFEPQQLQQFNPSVHDRLINLMITCDPKDYPMLLENLISLLDDDFFKQLTFLYRFAKDLEDDEFTNKLGRLLLSARSLVGRDE